MCCRKENYKDMEKYKRTRNKQKRKYYSKTAIYKPRIWTKQEMDLLFNSNITDTELSAIIQHSVSAIQKKRYILLKEKKELQKEKKL